MRRRWASSASARWTAHRSGGDPEARASPRGRGRDRRIRPVGRGGCDDLRGPVAAGGAQHRRVGGIPDDHRDVEVGRGRHARRCGVGFDGDHRAAGLDEHRGEGDAHRPQSADDRVAARPPGSEAGELLAEHDARRLQQRAGGDHGSDEARHLQSPVDRLGVALVAQRRELQCEVQVVEERRGRAEVVRLLDEPADPEHEQRGPQRGEQPPSSTRRTEEAHGVARVTGTWITWRSRSRATSTISAVPPRPRDGCPSHKASNTSHRSTMARPARSYADSRSASMSCSSGSGPVTSTCWAAASNSSNSVRDRSVAKSSPVLHGVERQDDAQLLGVGRHEVGGDPVRALGERRPDLDGRRISIAPQVDHRCDALAPDGFRVGEMSMTRDTDADHRGRWRREHGRCGQGADASEFASPPMRGLAARCVAAQ